MATPIPCDWEGCPNLADVLVSDIANGDGNGWCGPHYLEVCRQVAMAADDAAAEAEAREADADALRRLESLGTAPDPTASDESSDGTGAPDGGPGTPDGDGSDQDTPDGGTAVSEAPADQSGDLVASATE